MQTLTWIEFRNNVEAWAHSRGIYEQSSTPHQKAKFLEEAGEAVVAEAENDDDALSDAIGDMAVCIVNCARLDGHLIDFNHVFPQPDGQLVSVISEALEGSYDDAILGLVVYAEWQDLVFLECCTKAWEEIQPRKGLMIDGKFVKWENLTAEQQAECLARGQV
jgi:hypothetical protein